jgi:hypothetical protein
MAMVLLLNESITELDLSKASDQNFRCSGIHLGQKKYFFLCCNCYWMASTLHNSLEDPLVYYKNCPICNNETTSLSIPKIF